MAIPFYENEENLQAQQQNSEEVDQVDGHVIPNQNATASQGSTSPPSDASQEGSQQVNPVPVDPQHFMAWKILALAICKALKDHYQQNLANSSSSFSSNAFATSSSISAETQTAVIQILPNGQVNPQWN